jgi:hypothetical protein
MVQTILLTTPAPGEVVPCAPDKKVRKWEFDKMLASYGIPRTHPKDACVVLIAVCRSIRDQFQSEGFATI